jgi:hypothetical protein
MVEIEEILEDDPDYVKGKDYDTLAGVNLKTLKRGAKEKGLKGFSTMKKGDLIRLIILNLEGKAPKANMTVKRQKELKMPTTRTRKKATPSIVIPPKPKQKPPRVSRSMLMKRVKVKRDNVCSKFSKLSKKSVGQLKELL